MNRVKQLVHAENVYRMGLHGEKYPGGDTGHRRLSTSGSAAECGWISGFCGNETSLL